MWFVFLLKSVYIKYLLTGDCVHERVEQTFDHWSYRLATLLDCKNNNFNPIDLDVFSGCNDVYIYVYRLTITKL